MYFGGFIKKLDAKAQYCNIIITFLMKTFEELGVSNEIRRAIEEMGYENPMPVQQEVIPFLLEGVRDVIALAQTGTGKTAAFGLPLIQKVDLKSRATQALILCPTRELCLQIASDLVDYSKYINGLKVLPVYGGSSIESQIKALNRGVQIIVATPGRLIDLIKRKTVELDQVQHVVLDEADEMLNMGFLDSIDEILKQVPPTRSMLLFSATMPREIAKITRKYMDKPTEITVGNKNEGTSTVTHVYYMVHAKDKYLALKRIADFYPNIYGIIFCRTKRETQEIADKLIQDGYNADSLHGDLSQAQRDYVMNKFRLRNIQLLVATDVAARGLDVDSLTHVINYGLPDDVESYNHRSGRTGRAGRLGTAIAIIHTKEQSKVREIEKVLNRKFEHATIPTGESICKKQILNLVDKLEKVKVNEDEIKDLLPEVYRKLDWLEKEDIIKRLVSLEFNRFIEYYKEAEEIEVPVAGKRDRFEKGAKSDRNDRGRDRSRSPEKGFERIFINMGRTDSLSPANLMGLVNDYVAGKITIGKIDLMQNFSFFEVKESEVSKVISALNGQEYKGRRISTEIAQKNTSSSEGRGERRSSGGRRDFNSRGGDNRGRKESGGYGDRRRSDSNSGNSRSGSRRKPKY